MQEKENHENLKLVYNIAKIVLVLMLLLLTPLTVSAFVVFSQTKKQISLNVQPAVQKETSTPVKISFNDSDLQRKEVYNKCNNFNKFTLKHNIRFNIPILMYHHINNEYVNSKDPMLRYISVSTNKLEKDLEYINQKSYRTVLPGELITNNLAINSDKQVIITIDDGYKDIYTQAYPLFKKYNAKFVLYISPNLIDQNPGNDYLNWNEINEMCESGLMEIGAHTMSHKDLSILSNEEVKYEIEQSKNVLQMHCNCNITSFSYPYGKYTANTIDVVRSMFANAVSTLNSGFNERTNLFAIPRYMAKESEALSKVF